MHVLNKRTYLSLVGLLCFSFLVFTLFLAAGLHIIFWNSLEQSVDKGHVFDVSQLTHTFSIRNYSWRALDIRKPTASCGCTVVGELPNRVLPFRRLNIPVKVDIVGRAGPFKSSVTLPLGKLGVAKLEIIADIYAPLPDVVDVGEVRQGDVIQKLFYVNGSIGHDVVLGKKVENGVVLKCEQVEEMNVLRLEYKVPAVGGRFEAPIPLQNDLPNGHQRVLKGYALKRVEPNKSLLSMGYVKKSQPATQTVTFMSPYNEDFRWIPDRARHSRFVELNQIEGTVQNAIDVTLRGLESVGIYNEKIDLVFEVNDEADLEEVSLELYGYVLD